jgi:putative spermidine/putrescine transport system substrate-binding protein
MSMSLLIRRRSLLSAGSALAGASFLPRAWAADGSLVAATFPGSWADAHKGIVGPAFTKKTGATVTQSIILGVDQLSRLTAAKGGQPPFDVALLDMPQVGDAVKQGLLQEYPVAKSPNYANLLPAFQDKWGPRVSMNIVGIGYNPTKIKTAPETWESLWDPKYKGRVGLTALNSQLGIAFLAEINRLHGGTEDNFDPAFKALASLLPNVGAIAVNLGAFATLWQQEQIDIAPYNFNFTQTLKAKDVPVAFVSPQTGAVGWYTSMHLVAGAVAPDLAVDYIDTALDPAVQAAEAKPPNEIIPSNKTVALPASVMASVAKTHDELEKIRSFDWAKINPQRGELIDRFNREIKL